MSNFKAVIERRPDYESYKYVINYYKDDKKIDSVSSWYAFASTRWGAHSLSRRMLKKLNRNRAIGQKETITS